MAQLLIKRYSVNFLKTGQVIALFLCFNLSYSQINTAEDCINATRICDVTQNYYFEVNGAGSIDDALGTDNVYCLYKATPTVWEHHSVWFTFTPQYSGEFGFIICPDVTTDNWNFALFANALCSDLNNTAYWQFCNAQTPLAVTEGCTGMGVKNGYGVGGSNGLLPYFTIQAGTTYTLYANCRTYPDSTPRRATLSFQGAVVTAHTDLFNYPGCTMGTNEYALQDKVKVFPNPFQELINIESSVNLKNIEIYNLLGEKVLAQSFANQINTCNLQTGMYFMKLYTEENEVVVKKVVKK